MKILYYAWNDKIAYNLEMNLRKMAEVHTITYQFDDFRAEVLVSETFIAYIEHILQQEKYDAIFTYNFFPMLSDIALARQIKYISWVYDSPHYPLYNKAVYNPNNYFFIFDKMFAQDMKQRNILHVTHMPLAVDIERLNHLLHGVSGYDDDVTFLGNLYDNGECDSYVQFSKVSNYIEGYLHGIIESQLRVYGYPMVEELLQGYVMDELTDKVSLRTDIGLEFDKTTFFATEIYRYIAGVERKRMLQCIAGHIGQVTLYSEKRPTDIPNVSYKGSADYLEKMPVIFRKSKINLNMTVRSIKSGIPLRCLDIMGARGFLLSSYQPELAEYFENGKECVLYGSQEEMLALIDYYLEHDSEREQIARNGYEKVKNIFSFEKQVQKIFQIVFEGENR